MVMTIIGYNPLSYVLCYPYFQEGAFNNIITIKKEMTGTLDIGKLKCFVRGLKNCSRVGSLLKLKSLVHMLFYTRKVHFLK